MLCFYRSKSPQRESRSTHDSLHSGPAASAGAKGGGGIKTASKTLHIAVLKSL
jgi:hypothetical protein